MIQTNISEGTGTPVILIGEEDGSFLRKYGIELPVISVYGFDWNEMLSPWPAEKVFRKGEDFAGKADEFLAELETVLQEEKGIVCGYSLAGMFALYAVTKTDRFRAVASVSGSLWFPGFREYMKQNPVHCEAVYLSLGDKEPKTKNPVMGTVGEATEEIRQRISEDVPCVFEWNEGNHFQNAEERIAKGILSLRKSCKL